MRTSTLLLLLVIGPFLGCGNSNEPTDLYIVSASYNNPVTNPISTLWRSPIRTLRGTKIADQTSAYGTFAQMPRIGDKARCVIDGPHQLLCEVIERNTAPIPIFD